MESGGAPSGWKPLLFKKIKRHTDYTVEKEGNNFFVKAVSSDSASAILKEVQWDLKANPILSWKWKIQKALAGDGKKKSGDDYAARLYIAFKYDPKKASLWEKTKYGLVKTLYGAYPPKAVINYVWGNLPIGSAFPNPYTDRAWMIVLENGDERAGKWVKEERNVLEDYKSAFQKEPPEISFVALMTDTDNTHSAAVAFFDDISFYNYPVLNK